MKFFIFLALVTVSMAAVLKMPLKKITSKRDKMIAAGTWGNYIKQKRQMQKESRLSHGRSAHYGPTIRAQGSETTTDVDDNEYLAQIQVGTPPQTLHVDIDTGSTDFWLVDPACNSKCSSLLCSSSITCRFLCSDKTCCETMDRHIFETPQDTCQTDPCVGKTFYQSTSSSTFQNNGKRWKIQYGSGSCDGYTASDVVTFDSITVQSQVFGMAVGMSSAFDCDPADGLLGLAYPAIAEFDTNPLINNMISQNLLDQPIFAVYMTRAATGSIGGEISIGGYDNSKFTGNINYVPVSKQAYWQIGIDGVKVGTTVISSSSAQAISDTGTSWLIGASKANCDAIANAIGATYDEQQQLYTISNCNATMAPITFTINSQSYDVSPASYVYTDPTIGCYLGMQSDPSLIEVGVEWILGDVFIRDWYSIYDFGQNRIGMAKSIE